MRFGRVVVVAWVSLSVLSLAPSASQAYTQRFTVSGMPVRWSTPRVSMRVDPTLGMDAADSLEAGRVAFAAWGGIPNVPVLTLDGETQRAPGYTSGGPNENGAYRVASLPIGGTALAVTVSTYRQDDGILLDADILVKDSPDVATLSEPIRGRDARRYDLPSLLAHESGHVLGLGESMDDAAATMWPRLGLGDTSARTIASDDEAGVRAIYADVALDAGGDGASGDAGSLLGAGCGVTRRATRVPGTARGRWSSALAVGVLLGLALRARRRIRRRGYLVLALGLVVVLLATVSPRVQADERLRGVTRVLGTRWEGGLLMTDLEVVGLSGAIALTVPGGARDGLVQQVGDALPPEDGVTLSLEPPGADGWRRWTLASGATGVARRRHDPN